MKPFPSTASRAGLNVTADLTLSQKGRRIRITGRDRTFCFEAADAAAFAEFVNSWPGRRSLFQVRQLSRLLNANGMRIEVRFQGKQKAVLGQGVKSLPLRLLGLPNLKCSPELLWSMMRKK